MSHSHAILTSDEQTHLSKEAAQSEYLQSPWSLSYSTWSFPIQQIKFLSTTARKCSLKYKSTELALKGKKKPWITEEILIFILILSTNIFIKMLMKGNH